MIKKQLLMLIILLLTSSFTQAQELTLVASTWPPYVSQALPDNGLAIKVTKAVFERAGYKPNFRIQQWGDALEGSEIGVYDVLATVWRNKSREQQLLYSKPYLKNNIVFLARSDNTLDYQNSSDLAGLKIGVIDGYAYDEKFMNNPTILKVPSISLNENISLLLEGKLDLVVADKRLALYEMKQNFSDRRDKIIFLAKNLTIRNLYIAVAREHPKHQQIINDFNKAHEVMQKDGSFQKIINDYKF